MFFCLKKGFGYDKNICMSPHDSASSKLCYTNTSNFETAILGGCVKIQFG